MTLAHPRHPRVTAVARAKQPPNQLNHQLNHHLSSRLSSRLNRVLVVESRDRNWNNTPRPNLDQKKVASIIVQWQTVQRQMGYLTLRSLLQLFQLGRISMLPVTVTWFNPFRYINHELKRPFIILHTQQRPAIRIKTYHRVSGSHQWPCQLSRRPNLRAFHTRHPLLNVRSTYVTAVMVASAWGAPLTRSIILRDNTFKRWVL